VNTLNKGIQYEERSLQESEIAQILASPDFLKRLSALEQVLNLSLFENENLQPSLSNLPETLRNFQIEQEEKVLLKELQSFCDLKRSRDMTVTSIEFHPTLSGIILSFLLSAVIFLMPCHS
jgi:hypothetical protein